MIKPQLRWKLFRWIVVYPAIPPVIVTIGIFAYANWPRSIEGIFLPAAAHDTRNVTYLVHGKDDSANTWALEMISVISHQSSDDETFALDWNPFSNSLFRGAVDGRQIGKQLGAQLAQRANIESVHLVGHSAGSFVIYGFCEGVKQAAKNIKVHTTYLDPLSVYGIIRWHYGIRHFGDCADFSDAYIDTGDGVPGSNELLPNAHTFDVTGARLKSSFNGSPHIWPVYYYRGLMEKGDVPLLKVENSLANKYPAGKLTKID